MKTIGLLLLLGLSSSVFVPPRSGSGVQEEGQEPAKKRSENLVPRYFEEESERLDKGVQGSWMLVDYTDPLQQLFDSAASGFATFHDGFLTLILALDTVDDSLFGARAVLVVESGAYRYRFDEQANLQLSSVLSFSNQTSDGATESEPSGEVDEYQARLDDGVLELRTVDGVQFSFRKVAAGDFPDSAIRKLESRRSGTDQWDLDELEPR